MEITEVSIASPVVSWRNLVRCFSCILLSLTAMSVELQLKADDLTVTPTAHTPRHLAPGVLTVISPEPKEEETFSGPRELVDVVKGIDDLDWHPNFTPETRTLLEQSKSVIYRRAIWNLEFAFMPLRLLHVDIPQADGRMESKLVWYLVYRVKNHGRHLMPTPQEDAWGNQLFNASEVNHSVRFFPRFILVSHEKRQSHMDQLLPTALKQIKIQERLGRPLLDSVSISLADIPISTERINRSVWGVATWTGIDPHTDFFSVFVRGLTNAYRFTDSAADFQPGKPPGFTRHTEAKILQLNFWRPGDFVRENEQEVRFGIPGMSEPIPDQSILELYGLHKRLDYQWLYR
jgi:hypothetical protein